MLNESLIDLLLENPLAFAVDGSETESDYERLPLASFDGSTDSDDTAPEDDKHDFLRRCFDRTCRQLDDIEATIRANIDNKTLDDFLKRWLGMLLTRRVGIERHFASYAINTCRANLYKDERAIKAMSDTLDALDQSVEDFQITIDWYYNRPLEETIASIEDYGMDTPPPPKKRRVEV